LFKAVVFPTTAFFVDVMNLRARREQV